MQELSVSDFLEISSLGEKKVGYVAVIGRPNSGKSTFLNTLIGEKISIISPTPQTTRKRILAIYNDPLSQILFFDTPGIHKSEKNFNEHMNAEALSTLKEADIILYLRDMSREFGNEEAYIESLITPFQEKVIVGYTKSDLPPKQTEALDYPGAFLSCKDKTGYEDLISLIQERLPIGPMLFPEEYYTKQDIYFRVSEIIREKLFLSLKEELPHSVFVEIEQFEETEALLKISSYIYVESETQKYIVIGKGGNLLNTIGREARLDLEKLFEKKIFLGIRVKVRKNWRKDENFLKKMFQ